MNSSDDSVSIELYEDEPRRFVPVGKDCQQLFDDLFRHDADGRPDDNLPVKKPTRTYQRKPLYNIDNQQQHIDEDNFEGFSSENDEDDGSDGEEHHEDAPKKAKQRKKRSKFPKCTKTGVLQAYNKAIEMNELPDFENLELEELNIVTEEAPQLSSESENEPFNRDLDHLLETQSEHNDIENIENNLEFVNENSRYPLRRKTNKANSTYNVMPSSPPTTNVSNRTRRRLQNIINIDKSIIQSTNKHIKNSTPVRAKQKKKTKKSRKQSSVSSPNISIIRDISNF